MKSSVKNERIAGILFLLGFAGSVSAALLSPLTASDDIAQAFITHSRDVQISSVGILVMGFACTGIAIALYLVLRQKQEGMALGR